MPESAKNTSVSEIRTLLEENRQSIETLRCMLENLEVLLITLSQPATAPETADRAKPPVTRQPEP